MSTSTKFRSYNWQKVFRCFPHERPWWAQTRWFLQGPAEEPQRDVTSVAQNFNMFTRASKRRKKTITSLPEKQQHNGVLSDHDKEFH